MNVNNVFLVSDNGDMLSEEVGKKSYHDHVLGELFKEEVDVNFQIDETIYSDNAASIVSRYHYVVVFETETDVVTMFPNAATIEQKVFVFNHFYSRNQNLPVPKNMEVYIRQENQWKEVENIEVFLNDFETKFGGRNERIR